MIPSIKWLLYTCLVVTTSCKEKNEDITSTVNKDGSVETSVEVKHVDDAHDLLVTRHRVWVKNNVYKTVEYTDTIPSLGQENTVAENENGDKKNVAVPKAYEIFITVK
jgi:hypothetical protein